MSKSNLELNNLTKFRKVLLKKLVNTTLSASFDTLSIVSHATVVGIPAGKLGHL